MRFVRLGLLLLAFQLDVRVRAGSADLPLWDPPSCQQAAGECRVQAGRSLRLPLENGSLWAAADALLERKDGTWKLLKGAARVQGAAFETLHGRVETAGEAWAIDDGQRIIIRAVNEPARFLARDGRELNVPMGLEIWVRGLNSLGQNQHGVPSEIDLKDHLARWARMESASPESMRQTAAHLKELWSGRAETGAALYDGVVKRQMASVVEAERQQRALREKQKAERDSYRRLLHRTAFEK